MEQTTKILSIPQTQAARAPHLPKKKWIFFISLILFSALAVCLIRLYIKQPLERALDAIGASTIRRQGSFAWDGFDTHGGFLGDGTSYFSFQLAEEGKAQMGTILQKEGWHPLPAAGQIMDELEELLGSMVFGKYITEADSARLLAEIGQVSVGGWFFYDKSDKESLTNMNLAWTFGSEHRLANFVIAVYDSVTGKIYYFEEDR